MKSVTCPFPSLSVAEEHSDDHSSYISHYSTRTNKSDNHTLIVTNSKPIDNTSITSAQGTKEGSSFYSFTHTSVAADTVPTTGSTTATALHIEIGKKEKKKKKSKMSGAMSTLYHSIGALCSENVVSPVEKLIRSLSNMSTRDSLGGTETLRQDTTNVGNSHASSPCSASPSSCVCSCCSHSPPSSSSCFSSSSTCTCASSCSSCVVCGGEKKCGECQQSSNLPLDTYDDLLKAFIKLKKFLHRKKTVKYTDFNLHCTVGTGTFGRVRLVTLKDREGSEEERGLCHEHLHSHRQHHGHHCHSRSRCHSHRQFNLETHTHNNNNVTTNHKRLSNNNISSHQSSPCNIHSCSIHKCASSHCHSSAHRHQYNHMLHNHMCISTNNNNNNNNSNNDSNTADCSDCNNDNNDDCEGNINEEKISELIGSPSSSSSSPAAASLPSSSCTHASSSFYSAVAHPVSPTHHSSSFFSSAFGGQSGDLPPSSSSSSSSCSPCSCCSYDCSPPSLSSSPASSSSSPSSKACSCTCAHYSCNHNNQNTHTPSLSKCSASSSWPLLSSSPSSSSLPLPRVSSSSCYLCNAHFSKIPMALKILKKAEVIRLKQVEHVKDEKRILSKIQHPFIINMLASFQDDKKLYMLMEYINGGELFSYLRREGRLSNDHAMFYVAEIVLAFQYLHSLDIVYRDLKPENLLIDSWGHIKIADFGFAKVVSCNTRTWTLCGTPEYLAPEIIQSRGHNQSADWWALGILLYEMLAGFPPFYDSTPFGIYQKVLAGKIVFPKHFDRKAKDLIKRLLTADRTKRYGCLKNGAEDIKKHRWLRHLNWESCYNRQLQPLFIPHVSSFHDTSMYDNYPESDAETEDTSNNNNNAESSNKIKFNTSGGVGGGANLSSKMAKSPLTSNMTSTNTVLKRGSMSVCKKIEENYFVDF